MAKLPPALQNRALELAQPLSVYLELTYVCNWRCVFCYNPRHFDVRQLPLELWVEVLDDLRELGALTINLTGGEPLAHPQFFEIAEAVKTRRFVFNVFTNGALIDPVTADRLAELRPASVDLSLHGATAEVHDGATQKAGSFEKLWRAVALLQERDVRLTLKTPVTRENEAQLDAMIDLVARAGIEYRLDHVITPRDDGDMSNQKHRASDETVRRVLRMGFAGTQEAARVEGGVNCGLGRITMAIDPEGNVYPCIQWRHQSIGNVRNTRLTELWRHSDVRLQAAKVAVDANSMVIAASDEAVRSYGFCPALAFERAGDPLKFDATFLATAKLAADARQSSE